MLKLSQITTDPAYDILRSEHQPLNAIFAPKSVAVIGATDRLGSVGRTLLWNLISNPFGGTVFPINPKRHSVLGIKTYPTIQAVPEPVDLAVIVTPAPTVPGLIKDCIAAGVKGAIVISAGFKEAGAAGMALEQEIKDLIRQSDFRLIGPNCLGVMNPISGLNATFASTMARSGNVGFLSQSGALCTAVLDWSLQENVGFSAFVSIGSMLDVNWGDLIYYLGDDPKTESIVIYMESIGDARSFLSAAREVALTKPIIVIKAGRTAAAAKASASHTGALAGSDEVLDAAFRRCGVLRVDRIDELFDLAEVLAKQKRRPQGPRLSILTNAGGPGVLATDALIGTGGELAELSPPAIAQLNTFLPQHWSHGNPVDILGDADPDRYTQALEVLINDPNSDGLLVILTPQAMTDPVQTAEKLKLYAQQAEKPILASWMGGAEVSSGEAILNRASIATYPYPDTAARLFNSMWKYNYNLQGIYQTPSLVPNTADNAPDCDLVAHLIAQAQAEQRTTLTEAESKQVLAAYGIPTVISYTALSVEEAIQAAEQIGYPVVLKLVSKTITHKTDVGGVKLNLPDAASVALAYEAIQQSVRDRVGAEHIQGISVQPMINREDSYELIIGSSVDEQFGPTLLFGTGGQLVEVFRDRAIALPPLNTTLARRMMEQTRIYKALKGVRGRAPVDLEALEQLLVRFSQLVVEQPYIREIDINPLLISPVGTATAHTMYALDARVILQPLDLPASALPKPAIRPYPIQYVQPWTMADGTPIVLRPIRPEDEPLLVKFHENLSENSVYLRYFHLIKLSRRTAHERLTRICFIDYDRQIALVADHENPTTGAHEILGIGRLSRTHAANEAEFSMLIQDPYQHKGLGSEILRRLIGIGQDERLDRITAQILPENTAMQHVCEKAGFTLHRTAEFVQATFTFPAP